MDDVIIGRTIDEYNFKVLKSSDKDTNLLKDDVIIGDTVNTEFSFKPLMCADPDALCARLRLINESVGVLDKNLSSLGVPCKTKCIKGDGNCLFRSIAHAVCGNQEKHLKIRRAVVKHLEANSSKFVRYRREEYRSLKDYLTQSKMYFSGTWDSHVELFCAADLLKIDVMTFNDDRWNAHVPTEQLFTDNAIYLKHCNGNHYEVVTCVKHKNQGNVCAEACLNTEVDDQSTSRNL